jgi:hypothetical protein
MSPIGSRTRPAKARPDELRSPRAEGGSGLDIAVVALQLDVTPREISAQRRALVEAIAELVWNDAERPTAKP